MENLNKLLHGLHLDTWLSTSDIPDLDLYMDQVIQLFENKYGPTNRFPEEKVLTKTMINNYSKGKLFFPIKSKKYSPRHVMLINLIYEMKTVLAIRDIKQALDELNQRTMKETADLSQVYDIFLTLSESNLERFTISSKEIAEEVNNKLMENDTTDDRYLHELQLILSFVNMSNYYRRAAEALIDNLTPVTDEAKKD